ncbi:MAG: PQQ-dependent sugar dehydrogenase [Fibrobacterota bacterium]|nr:PQQ-dependent sugar dehydrogenase [Fibrobacterota bacterium]
MNNLSRIGLSVALFHIATLPSGAQSKWSYKNCADVTDADFKVETLIRQSIAPDPDLDEPDKLAFDMDAEGNVDLYFTEIRPGNIKYYNSRTKTVSTLVKLPVWKGPYYSKDNNRGDATEEGATGIALDPNFKTNGWIYIHWSPASASVFRISRFTVASGKIDLATEKIVLQFEAQREMCCHTGGSMQFDAYGDLWIAQGANGGNISGSIGTTPPIAINEEDNGKNKSEEWGASSTHGMRGSFLRIHPTPDGKYTIPAGNFGEYFYNQTKDPKYLDTTKVYPEIYIKGIRNNYSMALDPVRRWVLWGDVGADELSRDVREEFNLRTSPGFEGWPYFVGNNTKFVGNQDPAAPVNKSRWNTGLTTLPPARPRTVLPASFFASPSKMGPVPITGPLYLYDGDSKSKVKFPPHFNRKWFITDWTTSHLFVFDIDSAGNQVTGFQRFLPTTFEGPVDFRQGPDGALYIVNYGSGYFTSSSNTSIVKISYTGTCRPTDLKLETPTGLAQTRFDMIPRPSGFLINLGASSQVIIPRGMTGIELYDIKGKQVWSMRNLKAGETFRLPSGIQAGALKYRWIPAIH